MVVAKPGEEVIGLEEEEILAGGFFSSEEVL